MILETIVIIIYSIALVLIFAYALSQLNLLFNYMRAKKQDAQCPVYDLSKPDQVPYVTIQLPVYNELYVMDRLLENIAAMDYPSEKLEIQVLDDSTDESLHRTAKHIDRLRSEGVDIVHVTRSDRSGFKAGALKEGCGQQKVTLLPSLMRTSCRMQIGCKRPSPISRTKRSEWFKPVGDTSTATTPCSPGYRPLRWMLILPSNRSGATARGTSSTSTGPREYGGSSEFSMQATGKEIP